MQQAEIAQLVEHHFPKVRVAGSNPVFRSFLFLFVVRMLFQVQAISIIGR